MARRPINQTLLHLIGPVIIGICFVIIALYFAGSTCLLLWSGDSGTGHVVALARQEGTAGDEGDQKIVVFAPVFVFTTSDGAEHTVQSRTGSDPPGYVVGQAVRVLYRGDEPGSARIATFGQLWGPACGFGIAGLTLSAVGAVLLMWGRSRIRRGLPTTNDEWTQKWAARGMTTWF